MRKITMLGLLVALFLALFGFTLSAQATEPDGVNCVPKPGSSDSFGPWTNEGDPVRTEENIKPTVQVPAIEQFIPAGTVEEQVQTGTTTEFDHWQRYSWTGGPLDGAPTVVPPHEDWQPNVAGDPHGVGVAGPYDRSNEHSGRADWFYLEAVTKTVPVFETDIDYLWQKQVRQVIDGEDPEPCFVTKHVRTEFKIDVDCDSFVRIERKVFQDYRLLNDDGVLSPGEEFGFQYKGEWEVVDGPRAPTKSELNRYTARGAAACDEDRPVPSPEPTDAPEPTDDRPDSPEPVDEPVAVPTAVAAGLAGAEAAEDSEDPFNVLVGLAVVGALIAAVAGFLARRR